MTSLIYKGSKDESISIMGLEQNSKYFKHRLPEDGVMISDSFAEKYGVKREIPYNYRMNIPVKSIVSV